MNNISSNNGSNAVNVSSSITEQRWSSSSREQRWQLEQQVVRDRLPPGDLRTSSAAVEDCNSLSHHRLQAIDCPQAISHLSAHGDISGAYSGPGALQADSSLAPHEMALNGHWISSEDLLTDGSSDEEEELGRKKQDQLSRLKRHRRSPREGANYRDASLGEMVRTRTSRISIDGSN